MIATFVKALWVGICGTGIFVLAYYAFAGFK